MSVEQLLADLDRSDKKNVRELKNLWLQKPFAKPFHPPEPGAPRFSRYSTPKLIATVENQPDNLEAEQELKHRAYKRNKLARNFFIERNLKPVYEELNRQPPATIAGKPEPEQSTSTVKVSNENTRARVDAFIRMMSDAGPKITRKDIWTVAGYKARSELWRFETGKRCTAAATANFNRVLGMKPEEFALRLEAKSGSK
jgi:hypothetical protein